MRGAWKHKSSCAGAAPCFPQKCSSQHQERQQQQLLQQQNPAGVSPAGYTVCSSSGTTGKYFLASVRLCAWAATAMLTCMCHHASSTTRVNRQQPAHLPTSMSMHQLRVGHSNCPCYYCTMMLVTTHFWLTSATTSSAPGQPEVTSPVPTQQLIPCYSPSLPAV